MTITIEIDKDKDTSALKEYLSQSGYKFEVDEDDDVEYTDEFKAMLDRRWDDYESGRVKMVSAEESQRQIAALLAGRSK